MTSSWTASQQVTCDDALDGFRSDELLDGGGSACMMKYEMYDLMC